MKTLREDAHGFEEVFVCLRRLESGAQDSQASLDSYIVTAINRIKQALEKKVRDV